MMSDIILNGGAREDLGPILTALAHHNYRHKSFARGRHAIDPAEIARYADGYANHVVDGWYQDLAKHWPEKRDESKEDPTQPRERPVTQMVRMNLRESLRDEVNKFLTDAEGLESVYLLNEIVTDINNGEEPGMAIWHAMDRADIYVRVPAKHKERIEEFAHFLQEAAPQ